MQSYEFKDKVRAFLKKEKSEFFQLFKLPQKEDLRRAGFVSPRYSASTHIHVDSNVLSRNRCISILPDAPETESFRILRTQIIQRATQKGGNTFMITSALPGEGKTLTAINLAITFSREFNQTVLLVDCDLRKQSVHRYLGIDYGAGISDYLLDCKPISEIMIWPGIEKLTLISGGRTVLESGELLSSPKMGKLVTEMKERYPDRFIFFDLPPVLAVADAVSFAPMVDHIVVVTLANKTSIKDVKKALALLPRDKIMGLVLNKYQRPQKPYYYTRYPGEGAGVSK